MMDIFTSFSPEVLALFVLVGAIAGFIDSIAGGGGLLAMPALIIYGLDPASAIATVKMQAICGAATASLSYHRRGLISEPWIVKASFLSFIGGLVGASVLLFLPPDLLFRIIPVLLILIALYFSLAPMIDSETAKARIKTSSYLYGICPAIGFYDGFFGPGTGSFLTLAHHAGLALTIRKAIAHAKPINFASNLAALLVFLVNAKIIIPLGLVMGFGQILGATLGSAAASKHGAKIARPLLVLSSLTLAAKLLIDLWG